MRGILFVQIVFLPALISPYSNMNSHLESEDAKHFSQDQLESIEGEHHNAALVDRAVALKLAQEADPGPDRWSARGMYFFFLAGVIFMCSGDQGT